MNDERYIASHGGEGVITHEDIPLLANGKGRVLHLMKDGRWYNAEQICDAAGSDGRPAREGLRRMRDLRADGYVIDRRRIDGTCEFEYRIRPKEQRELF